MVSPLDQIGALASNPTGLPGASQTDLAIQDAMDEAEYQKQRADQIAFAYGQQGAGRGGASMLPDEKQFKFMFSVQPKVDDEERNIPWKTSTFLQSECLRHIQFGQFTTIQFNSIMREISDLQVQMSQDGTEEVTLQDWLELYTRILGYKGVIQDGRPTALEMIMAPVSKSEQTLTQKIQQPKRTGFFSFLGGKKQ